MDQDPKPGCSGIAPLQKHKQGKGFHTGEKTQIINVYNSLMEENPNIAVRDIVAKVASSLGVGKSSVFNILKEYRITGEVKSPKKQKPKEKTIINATDECTKTAIRRNIHAFFFRNEIPTLDKICTVVNSDPDLPNFSRTTLYRLLNHIGFTYEKRNRNSCLIDREEIILWRRRYLRAIRRYRAEGKCIYFMDETWVNAGHTKEKVWQDAAVTSSKDAFLKGLSTGLKNPSGKGKRLIVVHIGSESGFVNNALWVFESHSSKEYHEEMTGDAFQEWFGKILPSLEVGSVVVLDNAPYHSMKCERLPIQSWSKNKIISWLQSKQIPLESDNMLKRELFDLASKYKGAYDKYVVDEMAKAYNITVLRLPPYHCELNPIELIWSQVKGYVAANNTTFKINDVRRLLHEAVDQITAEKWANCVRHVIEVQEPRFWDVDDRMEQVEEMVINLADDSSTTSD